MVVNRQRQATLTGQHKVNDPCDKHRLTVTDLDGNYHIINERTSINMIPRWLTSGKVLVTVLAALPTVSKDKNWMNEDVTAKPERPLRDIAGFVIAQSD